MVTTWVRHMFDESQQYFWLVLSSYSIHSSFAVSSGLFYVEKLTGENYYYKILLAFEWTAAVSNTYNIERMVVLATQPRRQTSVISKNLTLSNNKGLIKSYLNPVNPNKNAVSKLLARTESLRCRLWTARRHLTDNWQLSWVTARNDRRFCERLYLPTQILCLEIRE